MHKNRLIIITAFVVSLGIGIAWAVHRPGADGAGAPPFTAMTCNVGDVGRLGFPVVETAAQITAGGKPDILFLQEMPSGKAGGALQETLEYPYQSAPALRRGKMAGLIVLSVYPIRDTREYPLLTHGKGAGALCAVVDIGSKNVTACSVHLDEVTPKKRDSGGVVAFTGREILEILRGEVFTDTVRTESAHSLVKALAKDAVSMPVIIGGDFNTVPGSRTIRQMTDHFQDALWPTFGYFTGTYHKIAFPVNPRIDYIFVSDGVAVLDAKVVKKSAGDHYPVTATLRLKS
ncbi:MAG: endonuclease/exonuclease/phosphatase family protein [Pseudomonadota bacterium]